MSTLLEVVQQFCARQAVPVPQMVIGNPDTQVSQIAALIQEGCESLRDRGPWERMTYQASWTTTNTEDQGDINTLAPNGYNWFVAKTWWDRTERLPLLGPTTPQTWQFLKAIVITGPRYSFRLRGGHLLSTPPPPAGHTWVFEYISKNYVLTQLGIYQENFTSDDDEILLPDAIVKADLRWRWLSAKGMAYAEYFNSAEALIADTLGKDGGSPDVDMGMRNCGGNIEPGIWVPSGTWPTV